jgi:CheY-like chemotaxis protein
MEVHQAGTAREALDLLEGGLQPSFVITDLRMPGAIDGRGVIDWMQRHRPAVPVIVASGFAADLVDGPTLNVTAIVSKPYDVRRLLALVSRPPACDASATRS